MEKRLEGLKIPNHVAIILDGNGRWAKKRGLPRNMGHIEGAKTVEQICEDAYNLGINYLTVYAFSTENWHRPQAEVDGLMELLVQAIIDETATLMDNNVRLQTIGNTQRLPRKARETLEECIRQSAGNTGTTLIIALSYSSRWEIAEAIRSICREGLRPEEVDEETLRRYLNTRDYPDPDLLIRTGGELRVSNFLLWQMAYTEFYFSEQLWPDFRHEDFYAAVYDYQQRQRRFGKTEAQVEAGL